MDKQDNTRGTSDSYTQHMVNLCDFYFAKLAVHGGFHQEQPPRIATVCSQVYTELVQTHSVPASRHQSSDCSSILVT